MRHTATGTPDPGPATHPVFAYWLAEAIRLREAYQGPLDDAQANRMACERADDLPGRILWRAGRLAADSGLQQHVQHWAHSARWAAILLLAAACLAGAGTAGTVLAQQDGRINLALALTGLLGLHLLTFTLWLLSRLPGLSGGRGLASLWLWLTRRLARGPDATLAGQALLSLLSRARATQAAMGLVSHALWSAGFLGMLPTLVLLLSTRQYRFHWETTLLPPQAFTHLTHWLGWLPGRFGFPLPPDAGIAASLNEPALSPAVQADWSLWLIGCILAWGLLPRVLALAACAIEWRHRLARLRIDPALPGWIDLRERLAPRHDSLGTDQPAPAQIQRMASAEPQPGPLSGRTAILAHELGPDLDWPPPDLPAHVQDLGRSDGRSDRQRLRAQLDPPPARLLLACDARLTPDRGTLRWFEELHTLCPGMRVACLGGDAGARLAIWQHALAERGIPVVADASGGFRTPEGSRHG
ncbi:DUF2868 domain-containing protein [Castellaniella sp.]|uniref:DUF2868 domain-containing protein n=1 Tax=Castellaniella sp. TaxID=1955812 RepID=UPI00356B20DD